ncbi:hypothetical protein ABZ722_13215 [Streptomyces longwoodensis]|uniref:hypothetical protein n=1 Tax=Streptomyces longwoodensis TaxID=68231 RepID=UPI0033FDA2C4
MPDMSASVSVAMAHLVPLAEVDENKVTPGVLGFIVFAAMAVAVWALMKSMNRHMGKVDFKEPPGAEDTPAGREAGTAAHATGSSEAGPQQG